MNLRARFGRPCPPFGCAVKPVQDRHFTRFRFDPERARDTHKVVGRVVPSVLYPGVALLPVALRGRAWADTGLGHDPIWEARVGPGVI